MTADCMVEDKRWDVLIDAAARVLRERPATQFWLVGGEQSRSSVRPALEAQVAERGIADRFHFLGFRDDVPALMRQTDILASPSRHEGMGRVNVEAMVAGKPVIGSAGTGIAEVIVDGETGLLVDPTDTDALADCLVRLAADSSLRARMGAAGRARAAAEFDQDRQLDKVLDELRAIADST